MKPTEKTKKNSSKVSSRLSLGERVPKLRFPGFEGEWIPTVLKSILHERKTYAEKDGSYPHATLSKEGIYGKTDRYDRDFLVSTENKEYKITLKNDLCYNPANLKFGVICLNTFGSAIFSPIYVTFEIDKSYSPQFVGAALTQKDFIGYALRFQQGTVYERMAVSPEDFLSISRRFPAIAEQEKIAEFISLLNSRIAAQRKLVELLKKHKRGLSSVLFSGKVRVATNAKWRTYRLGDIVRRVTRKNGKATDIPLTISAQHGLIDQREFFSKAVASADMSGYYLLKQGEFAYNRSSSGDYPFGSIKKLERYHQGAVSTLYICFETLGDKDDAEFLKWYFDSFAWHREIGMICAEGARNHGLLNVPTDGFFDTKHILPSDKDERKKIASLMALADARCECAETELARLTAMKSGLLQQMFV